MIDSTEKGVRRIIKEVRVFYKVQLKCGHILHIGLTKPKKNSKFLCNSCHSKLYFKQRTDDFHFL